MHDYVRADQEALQAEKQRELDGLRMQQERLREWADMIERGVLPDGEDKERHWHGIAFYLRAMADSKKLKPKRGKPPKIYDMGQACFWVHRKRLFEELSRDEAIGQVADAFGVDDSTVRKEYAVREEFIRGFYKGHPRN